ncbi:hypothetical protein F443_18465 [Phytophthora nicotianae P1569]|uniref:DDE Tnp4 domain-containing protein n=1 Tax=Phytophthora nicotianae P1569 TaxID=1317065 RepID=V9EA54_PHYNI|nr:hypothetical protein F443_18465 [Phytophthora nicotianae P1569]
MAETKGRSEPGSDRVGSRIPPSRWSTRRRGLGLSTCLAIFSRSGAPTRGAAIRPGSSGISSAKPGAMDEYEVPLWMLKAYQARKRRRVQVVATVAAIASIRGTPSDCVPRRRLNWGLHRQTLLLEGQFEQCYRMSAASFDRLLSFVRPGLLRDEIQSERRTGTDPITPENMLQMTISWLAGGSFHTTRCLAGVSPSGFYDVITAVMDALCECEELRIHSPTESSSRIEELASGFTKISKDGIMTGCVGCLDGWLCQIRAPSSREVPDVAAFFSGHYQMYGLNVQAICDSLCRFTGYCFDSPGKVGDSIAFKKWTLSDEIMELPP